MTKLPVRLAGLALLTCGWLTTLSAGRAQEKPKDLKVQRLQIWNGSERSVHYYGKGLSAKEKADLRDLEQAENDLASARHKASPEGQATSPTRVGSSGFIPPVGTGFPSYSWTSWNYPGFGYFGWGYPVLGYPYTDYPYWDYPGWGGFGRDGFGRGGFGRGNFGFGNFGRGGIGRGGIGRRGIGRRGIGRRGIGRSSFGRGNFGRGGFGFGNFGRGGFGFGNFGRGGFGRGGFGGGLYGYAGWGYPPVSSLAVSNYLSDLVAYLSSSAAVYPPLLPSGSTAYRGNGKGGKADSGNGERDPQKAVEDARRRRAQALACIAKSDRLRKALFPEGMPSIEKEPAAPKVTVALKNGTKIGPGKQVRQEKDWLVLDTGKEEVQIRRSEIASVTRSKNQK
jgi:hypothetical protein